MHLVVYFCGTGNEGDDFKYYSDYLKNPNVKTLFVEGCDTPQVCNSGLFPNLKAFAKRFSKKLFVKEANNVLVINPNDLQSIGIKKANSSDIDENNPIESITLCGYSRGAVTCFEVARELNEIAPHIPVDIIADQPVPGNCYQGPGTNAASIADCRTLTNLRNVSIILGAYTGTIYENFIQEKVLFTNPIHRGFFSQIVPKLPANTHRDLIVIPRESHHQGLINASTGNLHMHMQIGAYLNKQDKTLVSDRMVEKLTENAKKSYNRFAKFSPTLFPSQQKLQSFFGLNKKQAYLYIDKLHPSPNLRMGYTLGAQETLIDWWKKHDKNASRFSSHLTKDLVSLIENMDVNNFEALHELFIKADKWLLLKADSSSSRYYQVEALRNNIYERLITCEQNDKIGLALYNRANIEETHYFLNHWTTVSKTASYFKTEETRKLDDAFAEHDKNPYSQENDQLLMDALDKWLESKQTSNTKRWEDVIAIKEHLTQVMNNCYEITENPQNRFHA